MRLPKELLKDLIEREDGVDTVSLELREESKNFPYLRISIKFKPDTQDFFPRAISWSKVRLTGVSWEKREYYGIIFFDDLADMLNVNSVTP